MGLMPDPSGATPSLNPTTAAPPPATGGLLPEPGKIGLMPTPSKSPDPSVPMTPWGFVTNVAKGLGGLVEGLGTLFIKAPIHDAIQGVENILPGTQSLEREPSMLATIGRTALPGAWVPGPDLGGKYGAIASDYAKRYGSWSGFAHGLYSDPISYAMDALMVADGVGVVGKAGRVGKLTQYLPKIVSDEAAQSILGPALRQTTNALGETGWILDKYGPSLFASMTKGGGGVLPNGEAVKAAETLKLSKNFLVRGVQRFGYQRMSLAVDEARATDLAATARATEAINLAAEEGMRVLRPGVGEFIAKHETNKLLGMLRVSSKEASTSMVRDIRSAFPAKVADTETGAIRPLDRQVASEYARGMAVPPEGLPETAAIELDSTWKLLDEPPRASEFDIENANRLNESLPKKVKGERVDSLVAPEMPDAPRGGLKMTADSEFGGVDRYNVTVESLDQADSAAEAALASTGHTPIGKYDMLRDPANPIDALRYFGEKDGKIIEINVGTPDMLRAQGAAAAHLPYLRQLAARIRGKIKEIGDAPDAATGARLSEELRVLSGEQSAANSYLKGLFDDTRAQYWHDAGVGNAYNPELKAAWKSRVVEDQYIVQDWLKHTKEVRPYTTMMERAYLHVRVKKLFDSMARVRNEFERILDQPVATSEAARGQQQWDQLGDMIKTVERELPNMAEDMRDQIITDILGDRPFLGAEKHADLAAARLTRRMHNVMWDRAVVEGGHGAAFGLPEYDWALMHATALEEGRTVAHYVPDMPVGKPSQYLGKGRMNWNAIPTAYNKQARGLLFETGRADMDLMSALQRKAAIAVNHQQVTQTTMDVLAQYGHLLTEQEYKAITELGDARWTGEVFTSPQLVKSHLSMRAELAVDTLDNFIDNGGDLQQATADAVEQWAGKTFVESVNNLNPRGQVWAVPKAVADKLEQEVKLRLGHGVQLFWDGPTKVWKASVLSLSPRWLINNFFGNMLFAGIENPGAIRGMIGQMDARAQRLAEAVLGPRWLDETAGGLFLREINESAGSVVNRLTPKGEARYSALVGDVQRAQSLYGREGVALEAATRAEQLASRNIPGRTLHTVSQWVLGMNSQIESAARRGVLIDALAKQRLTGWVGAAHSSFDTLRTIAREGVNEQDFARALKSVDRTLGNFSRYSPIEQNIIRRFFLPFYGFYRHMVNVLVKFPLEHPLKAQVAREIGMLSESFEQNMPEYLRGQLGIDLGTFMGSDMLIRLKNLNPLSMINDDFGWIGAANPILKTVIERSLGVSTFTGEDFPMPTDGSMVQTRDGRYWSVMRDSNGNVIGVQPGSKPLPELGKHILSQFGGLNILPQFNLYPKSALASMIGFMGVPLTQPKRSLESSLAYDQEMQQSAVAQASAQENPFPDFGGGGAASPFGGGF